MTIRAYPVLYNISRLNSITYDLIDMNVVIHSVPANPCPVSLNK